MPPASVPGGRHRIPAILHHDVVDDDIIASINGNCRKNEPVGAGRQGIEIDGGAGNRVVLTTLIVFHPDVPHPVLHAFCFFQRKSDARFLDFDNRNHGRLPGSIPFHRAGRKARTCGEKKRHAYQGEQVAVPIFFD